MRVLVVEDEVKMAGLLKRALEEEGYAVDVAGRGEGRGSGSGPRTRTTRSSSTLMLPDIDGFEVSRKLREAGRWSPVLMLTARDAVDDRVEGLDAGADDYLTKPFSFAELLARLRALLRRGAASAHRCSRSGTSRWIRPVASLAEGPSSTSPRASSHSSSILCVIPARC